MAESFLLSVRMRASTAGRHIGGGERLVSAADWPDAVEGLAARAAQYGNVGEVRLYSELVAGDGIHRTRALPVRTSPAVSVEEARAEVAAITLQCGIPYSVTKDVMELLDSGPAPDDGVMRGAMLIDSTTGRRLEADASRGVRVSRVDYTPDCRAQLGTALQAAGLRSHRTQEALAIATKAAWAGVLCEVCWSDDPEYVAGYVAGPSIGYRRFTTIKESGSRMGGRAFFIHSGAQAPQIVNRLERQPLLIDSFSYIEGREL